jgi:hypothetical protein
MRAECSLFSLGDSTLSYGQITRSISAHVTGQMLLLHSSIQDFYCLATTINLSLYCIHL